MGPPFFVGSQEYLTITNYFTLYVEEAKIV